MEPEPRHDAVGVVGVLARQLARGLAELELILAHGALRAVRHVLRRDVHRGERVDRRRRRGRRAGAVVLRQTIDERVQVGAGEEPRRVDAGCRWTGIGTAQAAVRSRGRRRGRDAAETWAWRVGRVVVVLAPVYDPVAGGALVREQRRRLEEPLGRRVHGLARHGEFDLVEEAAEAARAEDVGGRGRHGAQRAAAHVAPVQAPPPALPPTGAVRAGL